MSEINPELLRVARDEVVKPRRRKQAAVEKAALITPGDPSQAPPGGDPSQMGAPAPGGPPPGAPGPGAPPPPGAPAPPAGDPSQPGGPGLPTPDPMGMIRQAVSEAMAQQGAASGGGKGTGKNSKDLIPELHSQIYRSNALLTMIANAMGLQVPPEAVQGPPPEQPPQTPQPNPQPQPQAAPQQQAGIPPMPPMDGQLPKAAAALLLDDEDEVQLQPVDLSKYGSLSSLFDDEPEPQVAAPVGTVYDALSMSHLRSSPTLLAARLRERNRLAQ